MIDYSGIVYAFAACSFMVIFALAGIAPLLLQKSRNLLTLTQLELAIFSIVISIIYLALSGVLLSILPIDFRRIVAVTVVFIPIVFGLFELHNFNKHSMLRFASCNEFVYLGGALAFTLVLLIVSNICFTLPNNLPDGAYVNKEHVTAVRIQYVTGNLPADNVVPYVVEEYLARDISFTENKPILPGQQVTNRPILVSLVALPIRLILRPVVTLVHLPTFNYVGTDWPDFRTLVRDEDTFSVFLGVGVYLNACLLLGVALLASLLPCFSKRRLSILLLALYVTSPYFIFQTLFTWPKALAGFFVLTAAYVYLKHNRVGIAGALIGLAYLSHPYAVAYFIVASYLLFISPASSMVARFKIIGAFMQAFFIIMLPWLLWAKLYIGISSDLVEQNFKLEGLTIYQFGWARVANLMNTIIPTHLLTHGKDFISMYSSSSFNLVGAVGSILFFCIICVRVIPFNLSATRGSYNFNSDSNLQKFRSALLFMVLSSILLTLVFSNPAIALVHGWQPMVGLMLVLSIYWVSQLGKVAEWLCWSQVLINIITFSIYYDSRIQL